MNSFFVKDILHFNYFFTNKKSFYFSPEKQLNSWITLFFLIILTYIFTEKFLIFADANLLFLVNFALIFLFFLIFLVSKDKNFTFKFLPILFFAIMNIAFYTFSQNFDENLVVNFSFLMKETSSNNDKLIGKQIIWTFFRSGMRIVFLLLFLIFNFSAIKKGFLRIFRNKDLMLLIFFILIIVFNFINFSHKLEFAKENSSSNQRAINQIIDKSSAFQKKYYYFGIIIITPIWEELFYRYVIFAIFGRKRVFWAIVFSVFFFTIAHYSSDDFKNVNNLWDFIGKIFSLPLLAYFYGGFLLSSIFWFYDLNLFFPIFFHFMWNFNTSFVEIFG